MRLACASLGGGPAREAAARLELRPAASPCSSVVSCPSPARLSMDRHGCVRRLWKPPPNTSLNGETHEGLRRQPVGCGQAGSVRPHNQRLRGRHRRLLQALVRRVEGGAARRRHSCYAIERRKRAVQAEDDPVDANHRSRQPSWSSRGAERRRNPARQFQPRTVTPQARPAMTARSKQETVGMTPRCTGPLGGAAEPGRRRQPPAGKGVIGRIPPIRLCSRVIAELGTVRIIVRHDGPGGDRRQNKRPTAPVRTPGEPRPRRRITRPGAQTYPP